MNSLLHPNAGQNMPAHRNPMAGPHDPKTSSNLIGTPNQNSHFPNSQSGSGLAGNLSNPAASSAHPQKSQIEIPKTEPLLHKD